MEEEFLKVIRTKLTLFEQSQLCSKVHFVYNIYMASFKNSRTFCVRNSIVKLFLKIEKNGENLHKLTVYNHIMMKKLFLYLLHLA